MSKTNVAVFVSGDGTNLQALMDARAESVDIAVVVCDVPGARAVERACSRGVPVEVIAATDFESREKFEKETVKRIAPHDTGLVVLAGFMRILTPWFINRFRNRIINVHPSLLPSFPGTNAVRQALVHGARLTGCTVHFVEEEVDAGPIILQESVEIRPEDTEDTLTERIRVLEHRLLPEAVRLFCEGKISIRGRKVVVSG